MATEYRGERSIEVDGRRPLIGVFIADDSDDVQYAVEGPSFESPAPSSGARAALTVIGAWSDMNWDELADSLEGIRHANQPTPPVELGAS